MAFFLPLLTPYFNQIEIGNILTPLWGGCGSIVQSRLDNKPCVIKAIKIPDHINHPRIKQSEFAVKRKQHSYSVEYTFYTFYSQYLPKHAQSIECIRAINKNDEYALVFKDFTQYGFTQARLQHIKAILKWLAHFHAFNLSKSTDGLWQQGNYWHLSTRPDEFNKLKDNLAKKSDIKNAAHKIDEQLQSCVYKTLIHGDAKLANFAANEKGEIRGYDFQYIGAGCGIIDVMYFMTSCLSDAQLHKCADIYITYYFDNLKSAITTYHPLAPVGKIADDWLALWPAAWADFYRFLAGWSPEHQKINSYMQQQVNSWLASNI